MANLQFRTGPLQGESVPLKDALRIGRSQDADVTLEDHTLSRIHCSFYNQGAIHFVEDLDSTNGTRVNGETVIIRRELQNGDVISVGETEISYVGAE